MPRDIVWGYIQDELGCLARARLEKHNTRAVEVLLSYGVSSEYIVGKVLGQSHTYGCLVRLGARIG